MGRIDKKGFIFTLDVILGMTIVFIVLIVTLFFFAQGSSISVSEHQLLRVGSDIVTLLDQQKAFDDLDYDIIETKLADVLPINYDLLLRVEGNFTMGNGTIEVGGEPTDARLIISGKKTVLNSDSEYLKVSYFVWPRKQ